jgi:hypothetical protein
MGEQRLRRAACAGGALFLLAVGGPAAWGKGAPSYISPGYHPKKVPHTFVPAKPPPPVVLQPSGNNPHVFVDGAGSAHIAFADPNGTGPDIIRTCRLPRGGKGCAAGAALSISQPMAGNDPQTNQDFDGPFPLAVGNELLVVDSRCCNRAGTGGSGFTETPVYLFTSEDAGATFTGPTDANPSAGLIGTQDPSGDAIVFGGDVPSIGLISSVQTGGTIFQGVPAGSFTTDTANLSLRPDDQDASDGRLGLDGTRPIAAFSDFSGTVTVREWTGNGSVNDASQWTILRITGADQPRIAGGPAGIALLTEPDISTGPLSVRTIATGGGAAGPPQLLAKQNAQAPTLSADPVSGMFAAAWIDGSDDSVHVRTSPDGRVWGPDRLVMRVPDGQLGQLDVAATADGGGFVALRDAKGAPTTYDGRILAGQFGPTGPTGKPGLGLVGGGSGPPSGDQAAYVACSQVHFGDVDIQATAGCFLRDPKNPSGGAAVAESAINLNGLQIVPDTGSRIFIDPRGHTLDTQGQVRVIAAGAGSNPVTLWHGPLHVDLPDAGAGATLFDFNMGEFAASVEGFGINARAKVILTKDGVRIPVDLDMPGYFGGITGHAELMVDATDGLKLNSLNFNIADVDIGVLELQNAHVQYQTDGDKWDGGATLVIPGPGISVNANVHFADGAFNGGDFEVTDFPGVPVFTDVFLTRVALGFQLKPAVFTGGVTFGFQPLVDRFTIAVAGDFRIEEGPPFAIQITGTGSVLGLQIATAFFRYSTDGTLIVRGDVKIGDPDTLGIKGGVHFGIIGDQWGGEFGVRGCAFGTPVTDPICVSATADANNTGIAVCLGDVGGITHDWADSIFLVEPHVGSCPSDPYKPPGGVRRALPRAVAATTFSVPAGAHAFDVALDGDGGVPNVTLTGPDGAPIPFGDPRVAKAAQIPGTGPVHTDYVGLREPAAGTYTVQTTAGSPAITGLRVSRGYATPTATATVGGAGRARTLRYAVKPVSGVDVQFVELGPAGAKAIGIAKGPHGTLRFHSGDGPGGRRTIVARAVRGGLAMTSAVVARYTAPPVPGPGAVGRIHLRRAGGALSIAFGPARGAESYLVKVLLTDGRGLERRLGAARHRLSVPGVARGVRAKVTVTPVGPDGRHGRARTARLGR